MAPDTLQIVDVRDRTEAERRGLVPLTDDEATMLRRMNRAQRRRWLHRRRREKGDPS